MTDIKDYGPVTLYPIGDRIGRVQLLDAMGRDITHVNAARVSHSKETFELTSGDIKLSKFLASSTPKHTSPFRHNYVQFRIKAPIPNARQFYKHVVGIETVEFDGCTFQSIMPDGSFKDHGWNEESGRYIVIEPQFYIPSARQWRLQAKNNKQASVADDFDALGGEILTEKAYKKAQDDYAFYKSLLDQGVSKEQARYFLPQCMYTEWIWSMSLQAALHFIELRDHPAAQWESRQYGIAVEKLLNLHFPTAITSWKEARTVITT